MNDGRCETCKQKRVGADLRDLQLDENPTQWSMVAYDCVVDNDSTLIAE